jgi:hypothetical protein
MENDNEEKPPTLNILETKDPTAFYMINGSIQVKDVDIEGTYDKVYKAVLDGILPNLVGSNTPRYIVSAIMSVAFDIATTAMAITTYADDETQGLTQEKDIEGFVATMLRMVNAMPQAIDANGQLLIANKSIFTKDKVQKLDS